MGKIPVLVIFSLLLGFFLLPSLVYAQSFGNFQVPLQGLPRSIDALAGDSDAVVKYIGAVFNIVLALIIGVALILIVVAGYLYITAGGDAQKVTLAKSLIGTSLLGVTLALSAYIILDLLSPNLASNLHQPARPARPVINNSEDPADTLNGDGDYTGSGGDWDSGLPSGGEGG